MQDSNLGLSGTCQRYLINSELLLNKKGSCDVVDLHSLRSSRSSYVPNEPDNQGTSPSVATKGNQNHRDSGTHEPSTEPRQSKWRERNNSGYHRGAVKHPASVPWALELMTSRWEASFYILAQVAKSNVRMTEHLAHILEHPFEEETTQYILSELDDLQ